jgi:hypothetical protein
MYPGMSAHFPLIPLISSEIRHLPEKQAVQLF